MKRTLEQIYYSFPVQLFLLHLQKNTMLLSVWLIILLWIVGGLGRSHGMMFLFLDPEYMGKVSFWSFLILGFSFGGFLMIWHLTTYMLHSFRFPFLASLKRPFLVFCINNFIFPSIFGLIYLGVLIYFQSYNEFAKGYSILYYVLSFAFGVFIVWLLVLSYFVATNKDIFKFVKRNNQRPPAPNRPMKSRRSTYKLSSLTTWNVDFYINDKLRTRRTRDVKHYKQTLLLKVFKQHHNNAIFFQVLSIISLLVLALMMDNPIFRIPAGASLFLLATVLTSIIGAAKFWFRGYRVIAFIGAILILNLLSSILPIKYKNRVVGLDYNSGLVQYSHDTLENLASAEHFTKDSLHTIQILNNWKNKHSKNGIAKPKMFVISASGGGLLATTWTTYVMQHIDKITQGQLLNNTTLMTGASGGMIGMTYMRDVYWNNLNNKSEPFGDDIHFKRMGSDLQNSIAFSIAVNDIFVPWMKFKDKDYTYRKDRGYMFECQLIENSDSILSKRLIDYREAEANAQIPMLYMTPVIADDARKLIISPQPVSFMMRPSRGFEKQDLFPDAIDYGQFFEKQNSYNTRMTSIIRMNATYPFILPNVTLPTEPTIEAIDAGWRDNYGFETSLRFIDVFKGWIKENTSGVVLIQIRSSEKYSPLEPNSEGYVQEWLSTLSVLGKMFDKQDFNSDTQISYLKQLLGEDQLNVVRFEYESEDASEEVSLSFHLTSREQKLIKESIDSENNKNALKQIEAFFE